MIVRTAVASSPWGRQSDFVPEVNRWLVSCAYRASVRSTTKPRGTANARNCERAELANDAARRWRPGNRGSINCSVETRNARRRGTREDSKTLLLFSRAQRLPLLFASSPFSPSSRLRPSPLLYQPRCLRNRVAGRLRRRTVRRSTHVRRAALHQNGVPAARRSR